jgi:pyruvate,water dikinase
MPWRENEELIYEMIKNYEEINTAPNKDHLEIQKSIKRKLKGRLLYKYAENYSYYRDRISSFYTYVYGLLRPLYLEIGKRMVDKDYLIDINDVFYIYKNEIENCISENNCSDFYCKVKERKHEIELAKDLSVPGIVYGNKAPPVKKHSGTVFRGVPTSHGFYMGKAKVLKGLGNMRKLEKGDVLVIPYSDVGWTPLFSKAGAVISESGGILSHSSIVAREYHIPAVVSVENACSIKDNTVVSVNGFTGEIGIIEE